jgi:hypothetical protein
VVRLCVCSPMHRAAVQLDKATVLRSLEPDFQTVKAALAAPDRPTAINMAACDM